MKRLKALRVRARYGIFSILAISSDRKLMGVGVASGALSVGDRVPHAKPGIGAVATQAYTNVIYGIKGLELIREGLSPHEALDKLLQEDPEKNLRQVAIMDFQRRKAVFTGALVSEYYAELCRRDHVVIGNMLSGKKVISNMAKEFENTSGHIASRIVNALRAGRESGGDRRGELSAALIVVNTKKVEMKITVDMHTDPIEELSRRLRSGR